MASRPILRKMKERALSYPRAVVGSRLSAYYAKRGKFIFDLSSRRGLEKSGYALVQKVRRETNMLMTDAEAYFIYEMVKKTEKISGEIAEVGVFRGGSAKIMSTVSRKPLHLFDTFEGLPELSEKDDAVQFHKGEFLASFEEVRRYVGGDSVSLYKGLFPETAGPVANKTFSFVHIDVDIYSSTKDCLDFFYPRMAAGGCIISHDYGPAKGARAAFDEFFADKPELIIEPYATGQACVIKVGG